ncbi:cytochrome P450 4g1-like [Haematobia irritans]|uniref:cytochrome P450 4g1-like n=1 Tax=Haematobia irritans TaxID=7368 RepID=UPI003F4F767E
MPCPPRLPLVGHAHLVIGKSIEDITAEALRFPEIYGKAICAWVGPNPIVFLADPADIQLVLDSNDHLEKSYEYRYFQPLVGKGLLISKGYRWRHHRKMIAPTFHQSILKSFTPTFAQHSKEVVRRLSTEMGKEFDVHEHMLQISVEILMATAMGVKEQMHGDKCLEYAKAMLDMRDIIHMRQTNFYYRFDALFTVSSLYKRYIKMLDIITGVTRKIINDRQRIIDAHSSAIVEKEIESTKLILSKKKEGLRDDLDDIDEQDVGVKKRLPFLDAMIVMSKDPEIKWNDQDIHDEVNTIMFEGHHTTSTASSFVLCLLGIHKGIQAKVIDEQNSIFGHDFQRDCTFDDTLQMNYLECVIMETLRLYPPIPIIARKAGRNIPLVSGPYTIPKDATIVISQYHVHRNPDEYSQPNEFNPDNFLANNMTKRHHYSFIPFSAGPRSCVGRKFAMLKLKVLLSTLLRNYTVDSRLKQSDFQSREDIFLKMAGGFNIILKQRYGYVDQME